MKVRKLQPKEINFLVRLMPQGDEFEVTASEQTLAKEIFEGISEEKLVIVELESGQTICYQMVNKEKNLPINMEDSLKNNGVVEGSTILILPNLVAG